MKRLPSASVLAVTLAFAHLCAGGSGLDMHRNDEWRAVPVDHVRLNGPLGRRVALTATRANVRDFDRGVGPSDPEVLLTEFADEDNTLTYFRTPWPESGLFVDDELFR